MQPLPAQARVLFPVNVARAMAHSTCIECARPSFLAICKECQQYEHCAPGEPFWQRPAPQKTAGCTEQQETPVRYVRKIRSGRIGHPDHCHRIRYVPKPGKRERHTIREAKSGHISETTDEPLRREDPFPAATSCAAISANPSCLDSHKLAREPDGC